MTLPPAPEMSESWSVSFVTASCAAAGVRDFDTPQATLPRNRGSTCVRNSLRCIVIFAEGQRASAVVATGVALMSRRSSASVSGRA